MVPSIVVFLVASSPSRSGQGQRGSGRTVMVSEAPIHPRSRFWVGGWVGYQLVRWVGGWARYQVVRLRCGATKIKTLDDLG